MYAGPRSIRLGVALVVLASLMALTAQCRSDEAKRAYLHLNASSHEEFNSAVNLAEDLGATLTHRFFPYAAFGTVPENVEALLEASPLIGRVYIGPVPQSGISGMVKHEGYLAQAYNDLFFASGAAGRVSGVGGIQDEDGARATDRPQEWPANGVRGDGGKPAAGQETISTNQQVLTDCRRVPKSYLVEMAATAAESEPPPIPPAICEFLLGHIAVGVIMPESNPDIGSLDWTESEEQTTVEETIAAMEWWITHGPRHGLWFTYDINYRVPVSVEPMAMGGAEIEDLWAGQSLEFLGYSGVNHFDQCYKYIEDMRERFEADWGFVSFILDGREDVSFGPYVAYGFIGGPFTVCINANGPIGPHNLDRIFGHVMGNTFYCLDEFGDSPFICLDRSGYLNVENANKLRGGDGCVPSVPCIMRGATEPFVLEDLSPCRYTRGHVGWWDEDEDGIPDILDTDPVLEAVAVDTAGLGEVIREDTLFATELSFRGTVAALPIPNENPLSLNSHRDFTVERVRAEYRVNGGDWVTCQPTDGRFDDSVEGFMFTASDLHPWFVSKIEVRGVTASGNVTPDSLHAAFEFHVVEPDVRSPYLRVVSSNPARPPVSIGFVPFDPSVEKGTFINVEIAVYDALGRKIRTVKSGNSVCGEFESVEWDGEDSNGNRVSAGVYLVGMSCGGQRQAQKIVVIP